jgi:hypothetical protein
MPRTEDIAFICILKESAWWRASEQEEEENNFALSVCLSRRFKRQHIEVGATFISRISRIY